MAGMMMAAMSTWGVWVPEVLWLHIKLRFELSLGELGAEATR
jgi:hypothetical protein